MPTLGGEGRRCYKALIREYRLYYTRGSIIVMIFQEVDTHHTLLQGHAILWDVIPLWLRLLTIIFILRRRPTSPHVYLTCYANNDMSPEHLFKTRNLPAARVFYHTSARVSSVPRLALRYHGTGARLFPGAMDPFLVMTTSIIDSRWRQYSNFCRTGQKFR